MSNQPEFRIERGRGGGGLFHSQPKTQMMGEGERERGREGEGERGRERGKLIMVIDRT
jgi:hypothetical protein